MFVPMGACEGANLQTDVGCITAKAFRDWRRLHVNVPGEKLQRDNSSHTLAK
jgi:hypothetical protein